MNQPLTRPAATLPPSDGEREGVRGSCARLRFMESVGMGIFCVALVVGCRSTGERPSARSGSPHPIVAWSFDQGKRDTVPDVSGHGYDARMNGNSRFVPRPGGGQAIEFDGNGSNAAWHSGEQDCGLSIEKRLRRAFKEISVEAWICKEPAWWMAVVYRDTWDEPDGFGLATEWSSGKIAFGHYDKTGHHSGVQSRTTVQDGKWHHVVGTMQPNGDGRYLYRIYVDGELDAEQTGTWGIAAASESGGVLKIAYPNASGAEKAYCGALGNIALFDVALTPAQVKARFQASRKAR